MSITLLIMLMSDRSTVMDNSFCFFIWDCIPYTGCCFKRVIYFFYHEFFWMIIPDG